MINNVVLVGRLTKDPDMRYTKDGTAVVTFTIAVNRNFTNSSGNREADFINCVIWRKSAENLAKFARKGSLVGITGRIQTRNYENQQGQRVYVTEVIADNFQMLESRIANEQRQQDIDDAYKNHFDNKSGKGDQQSHANNNLPPAGSTDPFSGSSIDISDDDLPF